MLEPACKRGNLFITMATYITRGAALMVEEAEEMKQQGQYHTTTTRAVLGFIIQGLGGRKEVVNPSFG